MTRTLILIILGLFACNVNAQTSTSPVKYDQPYGVIDTADLAMQQCDFEKDANAEVLIDKGDESFNDYLDIVFVIHKRIKIFNHNGKGKADIQLPFVDRITDMRAETINLDGKTITYTPVDVNLFYKQKVTSKEKMLTFTFPNVKPGSVIEMEYKWKMNGEILPFWFFQEDIPTRYSEINITFAGYSPYSVQLNNRQPFEKESLVALDGKDYSRGKKYTYVMANVPSFKTEPYMAQESNVRQKLRLKYHADYWSRVYMELKEDPDFGGQLDHKLADEDAIVAKMNLIKDKDARADSIFSFVQKKMKWNGVNVWYTYDGIKRAWSKKTGNSTEINLILYRLLTQANIEASPMMVSTPDYGPVDPDYARVGEFNKTVVYMPVDSTHFYVLDASDKHNVYNVIPYDVLSNYGFKIDPRFLKFNLFRVSSSRPSRQAVYIKADIQPTGKMSGEANITNDTYSRSATTELYKTLGEKKYTDYLRNDDNNLKISSLKLDTTSQDSLPMLQTFHFDLDLTASDENYIYFNPNLFTSFGKNPFLNKDRVSDVDFIFENTYVISGDYTIPKGYKIDVLPQSRVIMIEDKSISFRRIIGEQDGHILVHYVISRKKSYYTQDEYQALYSFYKEMFRMMSEQIVFKKS